MLSYLVLSEEILKFYILRASPLTSPTRPPTPFFHPDGKKRPSRAPGSLILPGFGPSSIRRAQAIPGLSGRARGLLIKEMRAKRQGNFPCVMWPRLVSERGRSSSSSHRLPRIVVFPAHRLLRAVKAATDGRPATRRGELMCGRLYIAAYRASGRPHSHASPQSTLHLLHLLHLLQASNGGLRIKRRRGQQRLRPALPALVGGPAALRGGLPGAARLPRARRLASERGRCPDPSAANGCRPRCRHR
jgi:hypothetical protein